MKPGCGILFFPGDERSDKSMLLRILILILPVISLLTACSGAGHVDLFERSEVGYYYGRAVTTIAEGEYRKATASLGEGLEKYRNSGLYTLRGYGYCKLGKYKEAIDDFNMAFKYRQTESFSIASINRHLSRNPYYKEAFLLANRGLAYSYSDDQEKARADVDRALQLEPGQSVWYCYRALIEIRSEDSDAALKDLKKAISLDPESPLPFHIRADIYESLSLPARAQKDRERATKLGYKIKDDITRYDIKQD